MVVTDNKGPVYGNAILMEYIDDLFVILHPDLNIDPLFHIPQRFLADGLKADKSKNAAGSSGQFNHMFIVDGIDRCLHPPFSIELSFNHTAE